MHESIGISQFAASRHFSPNSGNTWTLLNESELIQRVLESWHHRVPGQGETSLQRKIVVSIDPQGIFSVYVPLQAGMLLKSKVTCRQDGEDLFVETTTNESSVPAKFANVVLYSAEALEENGGSRATDANWEVVCLIGSDVEVEPMHPLAMARNMLEKPGGTKSDYSAQEFAESIYYWSQRVKVESGFKKELK